MKKFQRCPFRWPFTQIAKRSKRDILRITKRPAVWYFSIFLFENYQFLLEIFYLHLESSGASRQRKIWTLSFPPTLFTEYEEIQAWHLKKFSSDSSGQNSKYCKETVKWRTANVFTVKQLTICPGWLLRKTILEGFQWFGNFVLREIGSRRALHQGWKWVFKLARWIARNSCDVKRFSIECHCRCLSCITASPDSHQFAINCKKGSFVKLF